MALTLMPMNGSGRPWTHFEQAETLAPAGNDDPKLRWNTCARTIMQFNLQERPSDSPHPILE